MYLGEKNRFFHLEKRQGRVFFKVEARIRRKREKEHFIWRSLFYLLKKSRTSIIHCSINDVTYKKVYLYIRFEDDLSQNL